MPPGGCFVLTAPVTAEISYNICNGCITANDHPLYPRPERWGEHEGIQSGADRDGRGDRCSVREHWHLSRRSGQRAELGRWPGPDADDPAVGHLPQWCVSPGPQPADP